MQYFPWDYSVGEDLRTFDHDVDMLDFLLHQQSDSDRGQGLFEFWNDAFKGYKAFRLKRPCTKFTSEEEWMKTPEYEKLKKLTVTFKECSNEMVRYQVEAVILSKSEVEHAEKVLSRLILYSGNRLSLSTYDCDAVDKFSISLNKAWTNYELALNQLSQLRKDFAGYS
jgi:hypothetical protein